MKNRILFKTLIDIIYILHFMGLVGILFIIPFGVLHINQVDVKVEDWNLLYWLIFLVSLTAYIIFLRGLYYLRKMARFLLSNKYFSIKTIENLKKSGNHFLLAGGISFILNGFLWGNEFYQIITQVIYKPNFLISLFLVIIGMFFIIQSDALSLAKNMKEENDLTV